ncbi:TPM domain-containing protein [Deefgea tanakiae]|uniref:TPM domain-containing protein n=1 Tax=Deefgea tanakiae TaxID=2865840 RepID=A0ABX8Z321_9NEIS|nr:TPM domain-containing protein [Deefgea tanakiae]QZA76972.1 TPM domain-containing protein [Deefgea tanakiae]
MQKMKRLWLHLKPNPYRAQFNPALVDKLSGSIASAEQGHRGEIRLVVESSLPSALIWQNTTPRARAIDWFSQLRVWDTEGNTGILLYLLLAENQLELVADRGIASKVPQAQWDAICAQLQIHLGQNEIEIGLSTTISQLGQLLQEHFPLEIVQANPNELCNQPVIIL